MELDANMMILRLEYPSWSDEDLMTRIKDKELSEDDLYALELEAFMNLIQMTKTQERIKYTLETGIPLVN